MRAKWTVHYLTGNKCVGQQFTLSSELLIFYLESHAHSVNE